MLVYVLIVMMGGTLMEIHVSLVISPVNRAGMKRTVMNVYLWIIEILDLFATVWMDIMT